MTENAFIGFWIVGWVKYGTIKIAYEKFEFVTSPAVCT